MFDCDWHNDNPLASWQCVGETFLAMVQLYIPGAQTLTPKRRRIKTNDLALILNK